MKKELRQLNAQYRLKKQELNSVTDALTQAYRVFNISCDSTSIESSIFEINALRQRRNSIFQDMHSLDQERSKYGNHF